MLLSTKGTSGTFGTLGTYGTLGTLKHLNEAFKSNNHSTCRILFFKRGVDEVSWNKTRLS